jgi:hypothetical protein
MTYIHGVGKTLVESVISSISLVNQIVNICVLENWDLNLDHQPLVLNLNIDLDRKTNKDDPNFQNHLVFDKSKLTLKYLKRDFNLASINNNIEGLYHNFTMK